MFFLVELDNYLDGLCLVFQYFLPESQHFGPCPDFLQFHLLNLRKLQYLSEIKFFLSKLSNSMTHCKSSIHEPSFILIKRLDLKVFTQPHTDTSLPISLFFKIFFYFRMIQHNQSDKISFSLTAKILSILDINLLVKS